MDPVTDPEVHALREQNRMLRDAVECRWFPDDLSEDGEPTLPRGWAIIDAGRLDELEDLEERHRDNLRAVAAFEGAVRELEASNAELRRRISRAVSSLLCPPYSANEVRRLDEIHPAGFPPTYDGVRLGLAMMQDELNESLDAWRDERGLRRWVHTREELVQVAAIAVRVIREMDR